MCNVSNRKGSAGARKLRLTHAIMAFTLMLFSCIPGTLFYYQFMRDDSLAGLVFVFLFYGLGLLVLFMAVLRPLTEAVRGECASPAADDTIMRWTVPIASFFFKLLLTFVLMTVINLVYSGAVHFFMLTLPRIDGPFAAVVTGFGRGLVVWLVSAALLVCHIHIGRWPRYSWAVPLLGGAALTIWILPLLDAIGANRYSGQGAFGLLFLAVSVVTLCLHLSIYAIAWPRGTIEFSNIGLFTPIYGIRLSAPWEILREDSLPLRCVQYDEVARFLIVAPQRSIPWSTLNINVESPGGKQRQLPPVPIPEDKSLEELINILESTGIPVVGPTDSSESGGHGESYPGEGSGG